MIDTKTPADLAQDARILAGNFTALLAAPLWDGNYATKKIGEAIALLDILAAHIAPPPALPVSVDIWGEDEAPVPRSFKVGEPPHRWRETLSRLAKNDNLSDYQEATRRYAAASWKARNEAIEARLRTMKPGERLAVCEEDGSIECVFLSDGQSPERGKAWTVYGPAQEAAVPAAAAPRAFEVGDRVRNGMTQEEAEAAAYSAINEFIMCRNCIPVMLTTGGLAEIAGVAQRALGDGWVVTASKPDSDWSRTPAVTVRAAV